MSERSSAGRLSVVATPIGNLEDITARALRTLNEADLIAAEDTRHTQKLLRHFNIQTPLVSFHAHSPEQRSAQLADRIANGEHIAYVTDAGTPSVSDPGTALVRACQARGLEVTVVPGPSALSAAMAVSGIHSRAFTFFGFLPRSGNERQAELGNIVNSSLASVFFESPERVHATIEEIAQLADQDRELTICRELTKRHEEVRRAPLHDWVRALPTARGEFTLVLEGHTDAAKPAFDAPARAKELLAEGMSHRDAAKRLSFEGQLPRKEAYQRVLEAAQTSDEHGQD